MPQTNITKAKERAKSLGVQVKASTKKNKKLDVFAAIGDKLEKIASIGDKRYSDYLQHGDEARRKRYKARHEAHRHKKGTPAFYADRILW